MYTVEPVFGNIQGSRGKIILSLRGKVKVKGEWLLMCLVHNIRKIVRKVLVSGMGLIEMIFQPKVALPLAETKKSEMALANI